MSPKGVEEFAVAEVPALPLQLNFKLNVMACTVQSTQSQSCPRYYYLKICPSSPSARYRGRYVRYTGSGHSDVVLTEAHPVYLRFFMQDGKQLASFKDRTFGFVMSKRQDGSDNTSSSAKGVEMFEDKGDEGFWFDEVDGGKLKWKGTKANAPAESWAGWFLKENPPEVYKGNPQLFWSVGDSKNSEIDDSYRVDLVAEYL